MFSQASVILSMGGEVWQTPPGQTPAPPWTGTPPPNETATAADGTHPTGMHSCPYMIPS